MNSFRNSKGFTLVELLVVVAVITVGMVMAMQNKMRDIEKTHARQVAYDLVQVNNSVQRFVSKNSENIVDDMTMRGISWLKSSGCAMSNLPSWAFDYSYISCRAPETTQFGMTYITEIIVDDKTGNIETKTSVGPLSVNGSIRTDLAGLVALTARSISSVNRIENGSYISYCANDPECGASKGEILAFSDTTFSSDHLLRIDGANRMNADLKLGGFDVKEVNNVVVDGETVSTRVTAHEAKIASIDAGVVISKNGFETNGLVVGADIQIPEKSSTGKYMSLTRSVQSAVESHNGAKVQKPTCPKGMLPAGFAIPSFYDLKSKSLTGIDAFLVDTEYRDTKAVGGSKVVKEPKAGYWNTIIKYKTAKGWVYPDKSKAKATVLTKCE